MDTTMSDSDVILTDAEIAGLRKVTMPGDTDKMLDCIVALKEQRETLRNRLKQNAVDRHEVEQLEAERDSLKEQVRALIEERDSITRGARDDIDRASPIILNIFVVVEQ